MPRLAVGLPRLAPALLLSIVLSTFIATLYYFTFERSASRAYFVTSTSCAAVFNVYYLVRYLQRRAVLKCEALDGCDAWPASVIFPGKQERRNYLDGTFYVICVHVINAFSMFPTKVTPSLRQPESFATIVLILVLWTEIAISVVVFMQALIVRDSEDRVLCVQAHDLLCLQCKVYQCELDTKTPLSTHFRFQPIFTLAGSSLISVAFFFSSRNKNGIFPPRWAQLNTLITVLAVMHHIYLLSHMLPVSHLQRMFSVARNGDTESALVTSEKKQPTLSSSLLLIPPDRKEIIATTDAPIHVEKCQEVMSALFRAQEATLFLQPFDMRRYVNTKAIQHAIDLETIHKRLSQGRYSTMESFADDYRFMIQTHRTASLPTSQLTACADILDTIFERAWAEAMRKTLNDNERLSLRIILDKLVASEASFFFREPVDPIAQGVPTYYDVISKEEARDLRTIRKKLENDKYDSVDAFEVDMELMFANAIKWGGAKSDFGKLSIGLRRLVRNVLKEVNPRKKARMDSGGPGPAWPFTPLFSIWDPVLYVWGIYFTWGFFIFGILPDIVGLSWPSGIVELLSCLLCLNFVVGAVERSVFWNQSVETIAKCLQEGHEWKCTRMCDCDLNSEDKQAGKATLASIIFDDYKNMEVRRLYLGC